VTEIASLPSKGSLAITEEIDETNSQFLRIMSTEQK